MDPSVEVRRHPQLLSRPEPNLGWRKATQFALLISSVAALFTACGISPNRPSESFPTEPTGGTAHHGAPTTTEVRSALGAQTTSPADAPADGQPIINPVPQVFDAQYQPAATGSYPEQVSGSYDLNGHTVNVASTGTLLVQTANGSGLQTWSETSGKNQPADDLSVSFASTGVALQTETLGLEASTLSCSFAPPVPILPLQPDFGATTKSLASCGTFSANVTTVDEGTKTIAIEGTNYATLEVRSTIVTTGTTPATVTETSWVSSTLRLPLRAVQQTVTTYEGLPYQIMTTTDVTALPTA